MPEATTSKPSSKPATSDPARSILRSGLSRVLLLPLLAAGLLLPNACSTAAHQEMTWRQQVLAAGLNPESLPNPLETSQEMREVAEEVTIPGSDPREQLAQIQSYLFDEARFPFEYDARGTHTARQVFELRKGNCVSFTNLFIALGRTLGIPLRPALIERGEVEKEGDLVVINTHLVALYAHDDGITMYDFAQEREEPIKGLSILDDLWLTSIFLNNQGVDALRKGEHGEAVRQLGLAARLTPEFTAALGNLGVAYRQAGDPERALATYRRALEIEPGAPTILNNLASLYRSLGREAEARAALQAADLSGASPFMLVTRGDLELTQGNPRKALKLYKRARRSDPQLPAPWLAIARYHLRQDDLSAARKALERAVELAPEDQEVRRLEEDLSQRLAEGSGSV